MDSFDQLMAIVEAAQKDVEKADKGNKAAGTRVRKAMQDIKKQAQAVRQDVLSMRECSEDAPAPCCGDKPCPPPTGI